MSETDPPKPGLGCLKWLVLSFLLIVVLGLFIPISGRSEWVFELPYHLVAGCVLHANRALSHFATDLPRLMSAAILPSLATVVALWGTHRLVLWWRRATGRDRGWRFTHTALAGLLVLLGSAAAIALSGVLHELAWLPQGKVIRSNIRSASTAARSDARQLGLCLFEYETEHGKYPSSLQELESFATPATLKRLMFVELEDPAPPEPFILLRPGQSASGNPGRILLVSPLMSEEDGFAALKMDNSVTRLNAAEFAEVVKSAANEKQEGK